MTDWLWPKGFQDDAQVKQPNSALLCLVLFAFLLSITVPARAQQAAKIPRIGLIAASTRYSSTREQAFRQGLRELGYTEGKNVLIESRYPEGQRDRIPGLISELLQLKVDVLVLTSPPVVRAAKQATTTVPIVIVSTQDPVAAGYVNSLARPGGNITGVTQFTRNLSGKCLELLKDTIPTISRFGVFSVADAGAPQNALKEYEAAARNLELQLLGLKLQSAKPDIEGAFREAIKARVGAVITPANLFLQPYEKQIIDLAIRNHLPSMHERSDAVESGGLLSYSVDYVESFRRAALYVDKILKGTNPADLPIEQPTKLEFIINLKTAKQIGLMIPPNVLARADRVIR